jgi:hypothetical protein
MFRPVMGLLYIYLPLIEKTAKTLEFKNTYIRNIALPNSLE